MKIEKELPGVKRDILLKNYTTFKIGGPAKYFFIAKTKTDLILAIKMARKNSLPFFVLGKGSNILVSDEGFDGIAIKMKNEKLKIKNYNSKFKIFCESGMPLAKLVSKSLQIGATGLEWAMGIPGTVGGAIRGNAGAFGGSIGKLVKTVNVLNSENLKTKIFKNKDYDSPSASSRKAGPYCKFGYRDSIFKSKKNLIILSCEIQLEKSNKKIIQKKIKEYLARRKESQPLNFLSAGSTFKNFTPHRKEFYGAGPKSLKELKKFKKIGIIPAGYLIEKCGLKGKKIGNAKISEKQANFIINLGNGKAKDVIKLIKLIKKEVKNKFKINLEEEIQLLGF